VSKVDGRVLGSIDLGRDKEPSYQIDDIANRIFYRPSISTIEAYRFEDGQGYAARAAP
jgi:hypothetical protein